jgi:2-keto-4-pentenoate hydratase/2-oxohepta-3-ene-1,7-dioic acid hydratase in catechol pathway
MKLLRYTSPNFNGINSNSGVLIADTIFSYSGDPLVGQIVIGSPAAKLSEVSLLAPCTPSKIICFAINFSGIAGFSTKMSEPVVLVKPATCVCAPGDNVYNPFPELPWWGEAELAVVIKKRLQNISESEINDSILGFTIGNDTSVVNVEGRDHHLARSKCADRFCALGPWIDTEFDASDCLIEAVQNGEIIRRGRSSEQFWQWPKLVSWLSTWMTLEPWDVILTGNPPDTVGMRYLSDGDIYTARIEGLGELTNRFYLKK